MNPSQNIINRMTMPRISEEPDVPSEENTLFQDGRLTAMGMSSQVRHYMPESSTTIASEVANRNFQSTGISVQRPVLETPLYATPIREVDTEYIPVSYTSGLQSTGLQQETIYREVASSGTSQSLSYAEPVTRRDEKAIEKNLPFPVGGIPEQTIQSVQTSIPQEQILTSSAIPQQTQYVQSQRIVDQSIPVTRRDENVIIENLPVGGIQQSSGLQSYNPVQNITTSSVAYPQGNFEPARTEIVRETVTVTETQFPSQPIVSGIQQEVLVGPTVIENFSEINQMDSQYMRDSAVLRRPSAGSPGHISQWETQQFELSAMRHENHHAFETWEANRNLFVNDRLNIMSDLLAGLDRTLDWLDVGVNKVVLFFRERESQELEYSKRVRHGLTQVGEHFESAEHPEVLSNFSRGLKQNDAFHANEKRSSEIMGMYIRKDILDWVLLPSEKNYKLQSGALKGPLHAYKKKMDHLGSKRQKAYNKYFKVYDTIQKNGKPPKTEDSIFRRQLKYSLAAREELRMLRLYNEQGLLVINEYAKLNSTRLAEVQRAYTLYLTKYKELYQNTVNPPEPILNLIEHSNGPEVVPALFTVKNLLAPSNYDFVRKTLGYPPQVTYPSLDPFLVNFPDSVDPSRSSFVLKEWEAVKQGGMLKKSKPCSVIATSNNNLLIVERKRDDTEMGRVRDPMQRRYTRVEDVTPTEDGTVLKVVERAPGTLFHHTTRTRLKFETQGEAQQFMDFINNQTTDV